MGSEEGEGEAGEGVDEEGDKFNVIKEVISNPWSFRLYLSLQSFPGYVKPDWVKFPFL